MNNFLAELPLTNSLGDNADILGNVSSGPFGQLSGLITGLAVVIILVFLALYVYLSLAYSKIATKANLGNPGIAWMPSMGKLAITYQISKMHWWPFAALTAGLSIGYLVLMLGLNSLGMMLLGAIILYATIILFTVVSIVWHWKTYQAVGKPGWWILAPIIATFVGIIIAILSPIAGVIVMAIGLISHLVFIGIAAWSE